MKIPTPLTPYMETIKLVGALLLGCALLYAGQTVLEWREAAEQNEQRGRTMEATSGILVDGSKADAERDASDAGVQQGRDKFEAAYDEGVRNEPQTAVRADRAVPVRVRDAFKERRLARERLGCAGEQCDQRPQAEGPSER